MTPEALFDALRQLGPAAWFDAPGMLGVEAGAVLLMLTEDSATWDAEPPRPSQVGTILLGRAVAGGVRDAGADVEWSAGCGDTPTTELAARLLRLRPGWYAYEAAPRVHAGRVCVRDHHPMGGATGGNAAQAHLDSLLPLLWHARVRAVFVWPADVTSAGVTAAGAGPTRGVAGPLPRGAADAEGVGEILIAIDAGDAAAARDVVCAIREAHAREAHAREASAARDLDERTGQAPPRTHVDMDPSRRLTLARERYCDGVRTIQTLLRAGECYQVNLARHVDVVSPRDPLAVWLHLRARNRARRSMYLHTTHGAVVSNSPELLLHARGGALRSVPIKGTSTRTPEATESLRRSEKERAELRMIVDLVRADLGRVAIPGSVHVGPRQVGPVGHVQHAMQAVRATLAPGMDGHDAFRALFPAGSVTGAPRLRAMHVIRDLEEVPRGVYCGSLGAWLSPEPGDTRVGAWWNVAIRTVTFARGIARVHVGAGIVLDSDPAREFHETTLKARRMLEALA